MNMWFNYNQQNQSNNNNYFENKQNNWWEQFQKENEIIPIEVKASTNVRSQSLKIFSEKYKPKLSVRFSLLPYCDQTWMINIPLFAVCNL